MNNQSFTRVESMLSDVKKRFKDTSVLGIFLNNHDNARFLHNTNNRRNFQNALIFTLLTDGIPIVYYGDEQYFSGGNDPANREPLWG